jgi:FMN phosphatase YigB (HAD superfamily)
MLKTICLDLDETLLVNPNRHFLEPYLQALTQCAPELLSPTRFHAALQSAVQAATANRNPALSIEQVFNQHFYPAANLDPVALAPALAQFYTEIYPNLRQYTQPNPATAALMDWAVANQVEVAIATNPIFPRTAIEQRLAWAGVDLSAVRWVTTFENSHFTKPAPEYYAEILANLNCAPHEVLMVGNDWLQDIAPAQRVGLATFWITEPSEPRGLGSGCLLGQGTLTDCLAWLRPFWADQFAPTSNRQGWHIPVTPASILAQLRANCAPFYALLAELSDVEWRARPQPTEWAPVEIICHLRDTEREVLQMRIARFLQEDRPFLVVQQPDSWAEVRGYRSQFGQEAFGEWLAARQATIRHLASLPDSAWERTARHAIFGTLTLTELLAVMTEHDRTHLAQLRRTLQIVRA